MHLLKILTLSPSSSASMMAAFCRAIETVLHSLLVRLARVGIIRWSRGLWLVSWNFIIRLWNGRISSVFSSGDSTCGWCFVSTNEVNMIPCKSYIACIGECSKLRDPCFSMDHFFGIRASAGEEYLYPVFSLEAEDRSFWYQSCLWCWMHLLVLGCYQLSLS